MRHRATRLAERRVRCRPAPPIGLVAAAKPRGDSNSPPCGARAGATLPALRSSDGPRRRGKAATPRSNPIADAAGAVFAGKRATVERAGQSLAPTLIHETIRGALPPRERDPERAPAHTAPADHRHRRAVERPHTRLRRPTGAGAPAPTGSATSSRNVARRAAG